MIKTAAFHTLGCKVNRYETEALSDMLIERGYEVVGFDEIADVYIINTCTVTGISARKSRNAVRKARRMNPDAIVVMTGCYPQTTPEEAKEIDDADIITGTGNRAGIVDLIEEFTRNRLKISSIDNIMGKNNYEELKVDSFRERTRAFVKIQDGCSRFCSYCIIPYARGPVRSRNSHNIIDEISALAKQGFSEIVLTGIHLASYGLDIGGTDLLDIVKQIHDIPGVERVRLSSLEPTFITPKFIALAKRLPKLCPHFHVSMQSGCDATLKRMNRKYSSEQYRKVVMELKESIKDVSVTTDVMVGFPGETEEEFRETYEFLKNLPLTQMHVFKYSPRKGTPAASFENQVESEVKEERSKLLLKMSEEKLLEFNRGFEGRTLRVLFEGEAADMPGMVEGRSDNYIRVVCKGDPDLHGMSRTVLLEKANRDYVAGAILKREHPETN